SSLQGSRIECLENLKEFDSISVSQKYYLAIHYGNLVLFHLEHGELGEPLEKAIESFHSLRIPASGGPLTIRHFYVFQAYARLEQCTSATPKNLDEAVKNLKIAAAQLKAVARTPVLKAHSILIKSAVMKYTGNYRAALDYLSMAENIAREIDCPLALFEAIRMRAKLLLKSGNSASAGREAKIAFALAHELGWSHRVRLIRNEFAMEDFELEPASKGSVSRGSRKSSTASNLNLQRQLDALMQLSLASGSILNPERQARAALDEIVRLLGAERAFIFLTHEGSNDLTMKAGRDSQGQDIKELRGYSTTVVEDVRASKKAVIVSGTDDGTVRGSQSAFAHNLRSIMAAPMMIGDRLVGVVYLDSRLAKGIFTEDDVDILLALGNHIAIAQETARSAQLEMERKSLEKDLELAGAVQNLLLPKENAFLSDHIKMASYYKTATQSGGDWWWFSQDEGIRAKALVGDVTGHGAGSAMMTSAISSSYRTLSILGQVEDIPKVFKILNTNILDIGSDTYSMTMSAVELDSTTNELRFWNAGAPPIFILKPDGTVETIVERSTPLGTEEFQMASRKIQLQKGTRIFIFTDGLYEFTYEGKNYGRKKLQALFVETRNLSIEAARDKIAAHVNSLIGKSVLEDDMTFVLLDNY
ncbi:MAG: GAF domain-containing SpoIIE family protein phosphatase, partial [Bdellovibrionota bacterium]